MMCGVNERLGGSRRRQRESTNTIPLEIRKQRDGRWRDTWFGRYEVNGERFCHNLGVKIACTPPASGSLMDEGDGAFERSRQAALSKLEAIVEEVRSKQHATRLVEKMYEIKTGEQIRSVKPTDLEQEWAKIPRKHEPDERSVVLSITKTANESA